MKNTLALTVIGTIVAVGVSAHGAETPTVEEVSAAFTGVSETITSRGQQLNMTYHPGGKLELVVDRPGAPLRVDREWYVKPDSQICTFGSSGETCFKTEKDGGTVFRLRPDGTRGTKGFPIRK